MTPAHRSRHAEARRIARHVVDMLAEVEAGIRPARLVAPLLAAHLRAPLVPRGRGSVPMARVQRLVVTPCAADSWDVVAVRRHPGRVSALSLRLRRDATGGWQVTELAKPAVPDESTSTRVRSAEWAS